MIKTYYTAKGPVTSLRSYTFYRKSGRALIFYATDAREAAMMALRWGQRRGYKIYRKPSAS